MKFRAVLVVSKATHFLAWWISASLALCIALPQHGCPYNFRVRIISLGRISFTGNMICGGRGNNSRVGAAHVLHCLPWYCEGTGRHEGSRPLGCLQCLNISTIIWISRVHEGRIYTTMSFLDWCSYLFQYTKMVTIRVKCWEIDYRAMGWEFHLPE